MRKIHYVGSLPPELIRKGPLLAMDWAIGVADAWPADSKFPNQQHELTGVPCDLDPRWIINYLDDLGEHREAFRAIRTGGSADYDSMPLYRVTRGRKLTADDVSMNRAYKVKAVIDSYQRLRQKTDADLPPLRISLPNPLDLALFTFVGKIDLKRHFARTVRGTWLALRNLKHFIEAMRREVVELQDYATTGGQPEVVNGVKVTEIVPIVFQFEAPSVRYALNFLPRPLRRLAASLLARQVTHCLALIWHVEQELHLCDGDLGHKNITVPDSCDDMVMFLNALGDHLEHAGVDKPPVHLPFASGDKPAHTDPAFYEPLARLAKDWRIYAGVVDENHPEASRVALHLVEHHSGRTAEAVACACGLGRRTLDDARRAVEACVALAGADRADGDE